MQIRKYPLSDSEMDLQNESDEKTDYSFDQNSEDPSRLDQAIIGNLEVTTIVKVKGVNDNGKLGEENLKLPINPYTQAFFEQKLSEGKILTEPEVTEFGKFLTLKTDKANEKNYGDLLISLGKDIELNLATEEAQTLLEKIALMFNTRYFKIGLTLKRYPHEQKIHDILDLLRTEKESLENALKEIKPKTISPIINFGNTFLAESSVLEKEKKRVAQDGDIKKKMHLLNTLNALIEKHQKALSRFEMADSRNLIAIKALRNK